MMNTTQTLHAKDLFERCAQMPIDRAAWKDFFDRFNAGVEQAVRKIIGYPGVGRYSHLFDDVMQRFFQRLLENDRRALLAFRGLDDDDRQARAYLRLVATAVAYRTITTERGRDFSLDNLEVENIESSRSHPIALLPELENNTEGVLALTISVDEGLMHICRGFNKYRNILIFKLFALDGFKPHEISEIRGFETSRVAIEKLISRIRTKLRAFFQSPTWGNNVNNATYSSAEASRECLNHESISMFINGELPRIESRIVEKHLAVCPECREHLVDLIPFFLTEK